MRSTQSRRSAMLAVGLIFCAGSAAAQYTPVGVQTNVPEATVTAGGWTVCHSSTFSESGTPLATIQANCDKALLMMACRPVGDPNYTLLAEAPRADVFFDTGTGDTPHNSNGVGWYYNDSYSWGFAPQGLALNRDSCDYDDGSQVQPEMRMCIHTGGGTTNNGYRCGTTTPGASWERLILEADDGPPGVNLGNAGLNRPVVIAEELKIPPNRTLTNAANQLDVVTQVGYAFSQGEVRYARLSCPGISFGAGTSVDFSSDASNTVGAVNGLGTNAIYFSITAGATPVVATDTLRVGGDRLITAKQAVDCSYGLYDTPSEAQAGGSEGRVATASGGYLRFGPSYALSIDSRGSAVADVESDAPAFSAFTNTGPTFDPGVGQLGGFSYGITQSVLGSTQPITLDGDAVTLADLMDADTALVFTGNFDAASEVYLSQDSDCNGMDVIADGFDEMSAVFTIGASDALYSYLCYEAGGDPIATDDFTVALEPVSASASTYVLGDLGPYALGTITHNGTELQAPLVQVPTGYRSRIALTNTGSVARPYEMRVMTETGVAAAFSNDHGTIPAGSLVVIDLPEVLTITGATRATVNVNVAAPNNQIQGVYQILNPAAGSISNHVMVRPGTN